MKNNGPIILFGTGRSGTTLIHQIMTRHPKLAWMSKFCKVFPRRPALNRMLLEFLDLPVAGDLLRSHFLAGECYSFWETYSPGFGRPFRDLLAEDLTEKSRRDIRAAFEQLATSKRERVLLKVTGWPRVGFLSSVFEGAKFIHVVRDGRAVANSLLNVDFWRGWQGPENWRWGPLPDPYNEEWMRHEQSFVVLAGIQWKILMDAAERSIKLAAERGIDVLEIRYEDLCDNPSSVLQKIAEFSDIDFVPEFRSSLESFELVNTNDKYRRDLGEQQQAALNAVLSTRLEQYGYE